jgi:hypothetical protein
MTPKKRSPMFIIAFLISIMWVMTLVPLFLLMLMNGFSQGFLFTISGLVMLVFGVTLLYAAYQFWRLNKWSFVFFGVLALLAIVATSILAISNRFFSGMAGILVDIILIFIALANYYLYLKVSATDDIDNKN